MAKAQNNQANKTAKEEVKKDIVLVKFLKSFTPYIKGEVAGFDKKFANKLIDKEVAEEFEE